MTPNLWGASSVSVPDTDPDWIGFNPDSIRSMDPCPIRNLDPEPDPGGQKLPTKIEKNSEISCLKC
jgi:hypothetical protein